MFSILTQRSSLVALVLGIVFSAATAFANEAVNSDKTGLALSGYDPVAYHTEGKPVQGNFQITAEHDGAFYRFANEANKSAFVANPSKYLPQHGEYCSFGAAIGKKFTADPTVWLIQDGKLYLNLNPAIGEKFKEQLSDNIVKADANWTKIKDQPAAEVNK